MLETNSLTGLLAFFFYENRYLSIPALGRLELSGDSPPVPEESRQHAFPKGSISFVSNQSEPLDPVLVEYITSRTRKMKALAVADLNSVSDLAKEMLNMRQSYTFAGIATIIPGIHGDFIVTPEKLLSAPQHVNRQTASEMFRQEIKEDPLHEKEVHSSGGRRTFGGAIIVIICILIVVTLVYFLLPHEETNSPRMATNEKNDHVVQSPDSVGADPSRSEKAASPDSLAKNVRSPSLSDTGMLHYEVVFEEADSARAIRRYNQLTGWGHKIIMRTKDSSVYSLAVPVTGAAADTTTIKDSIRVLYGHPVYIRY
jgi:hypothetical protein